MPDVELINQLVEGDMSVFPAFHGRYHRVIAHCMREKTRMEPDDLMQDFFLKLQATRFRDLNRWNRQTPLPIFLRHIVRNFVIDRYRADPTSPGRTNKSVNPDPNDDTLRQSAVTRFVANRARLFGRGTSAPGRLVFESMEAENWYVSDAADAGPDAALESRQLRRRGLEAWARLMSGRDRRLICIKFYRETPADQAAAVEGLSAGAYRKAVFDAQKRYLAHLRILAPEFFS